MNNLEKHVLEMIGENTSSPDVFLDTDDGLEPIRDSINDGIQELSIMTGAYKREYILPLRKEQTFYRMEFAQDEFGWITDCWYIQNQWRLRQTDLLRESREDPRWMIHTGPPERYMQVGLDIVGFSPRPADNTVTLSLNCVTIPGPYETSTDRIKLRDNFHWAVVHYAVGEYYAGRGDAREAQNHHSKFLDKLGLQEMYPESSENQYRARS
jgi:hypothetical protein